MPLPDADTTRAILERSPTVIFAWSPEPGWAVSFVTANVARWGYAPAELLDGTFSYAELIDPRDREAVSADLEAALARGTTEISHEYRVLHRDGTAHWVLASVRAARDDGGEVTGFEGALFPIGDRKRREHALELRERALDAIDAGVTIADMRRPDQPLIYASQGFCRLTGYASEDILGRNCRFLQGDDRDQPQRAAIRAALAGGFSAKVVLRNYRRDGSMFWNELSLSPILDADGKVTHTVGVQMDVTDRVADRERLRAAAHTDPLTGYSNREGFEAALAQQLGPGGAGYVVVIADVRDMQGINTTSGESQGDQVLLEAARRCAAAVPGAVVARFGGDQVAAGIPVAGEAEASAVPARVLDGLKEPFVLHGVTFRVVFAVGCVHAGRDTSPQTAVAQADMARQAAKAPGHDTVRWFSQHMAATAERRVRLTEALRHALDEQAFELHFQPKVWTATGELAGAEALLRWNHPTLGMQSPATFIPLAEASGLIVPIGEWVLRRVCRVLADLDAEGAAPPSVAVNVSAAQIAGGDIGTRLPAIADEHGIDPARVTLELTETAFAGGAESVALLETLNRAGFPIALDDFGTGYSALSALQRYPLSEIKIDRSFAGDAANTAFSHTIVVMIQRIADTLGCHTVAEGVETDADLAAVWRAGCQQIQGFYLAKPLKIDAFTELLRGGETTWDLG